MVVKLIKIATVALGVAMLAVACTSSTDVSSGSGDGDADQSAFVYKANPFGAGGVQVGQSQLLAPTAQNDFTPVMPKNLPPSEEWVLHGNGAAIAFNYPSSQMQVTETIVDVASPSKYLADAIGPPSASPGCVPNSAGGQDCHYYPFRAAALADGTSAMVAADGGTTVVWFAPLQNASSSATAGFQHPALMVQLNAPASAQLSASQALSYANAFTPTGYATASP